MNKNEIIELYQLIKTDYEVTLEMMEQNPFKYGIKIKEFAEKITSLNIKIRSLQNGKK